jgi:hypothetical protein
LAYSPNKRAWTTRALEHLARTPLSAEHPLITFVSQIVEYLEKP